MDFIHIVYIFNIAFMTVYLKNTVNAVMYYRFEDRNTYIALNFSSFLYILIFSLGMYFEFKEKNLVILGQSAFLVAVIIFYSYLSLFGNLFELSSKLLSRLIKFYKVMTAIVVLAVITYIFTDYALILDYNAPPKIPFFEKLKLGNQMLPLGYLVTSILLPVNLYVMYRIAKKTLRSKHQRLIGIGLLFSLMAIINDSLFAVKTFYYYVPLLGFVNIIEIAYATYVLDRRAQDKIENLATTVHEKEKVNEMMFNTIHDIANSSVVILYKIKSAFKITQNEAYTIENNEKIHSMLDQAMKSAKFNCDVLIKHKNIVRSMNDIQNKKVLIVECLNTAIDVVSPKKYAVSIEVYSFDKNASIYATKIDLIQVLVNLISNSVQAVGSNEAKWIKIETLRENKNLVIRISDSGLYKDIENPEKLFTRFHTTKEDGSGIGLNSSRKNIEMMGGTLEIDPNALHTTFEIKIKEYQA